MHEAIDNSLRVAKQHQLRYRRAKEADRSGQNTVTLFVSLLATVAGASAALTICILAGLSRHECVINTISGALLVGGGVFSLLNYRRAQRNHGVEIKRILEAEAFDANLAGQRAIAEQSMTAPAEGSEPYRHHEDHAESPGYDQGQLTSRLPGTTPFLGHFDKK